MNRRTRWLPGVSFVLAAIVLIAPDPVWAQNTTPGTREHYLIGTLKNVTPGASESRWYDFRANAGRSYCLEAASAEFETDVVDTVVTVYSDTSGTTLLVSNDDMPSTQEPSGVFASRACFIAASSFTGTFLVRNFGGATGDSIQFRMIDTTIWSSWFFIGGDYNAFLLARNTTRRAVNYTVTFRSAAGAVVGTTSGAVAADSAIVLNARTFVAGVTNGTVEIAHDAAPGAIVGQMTSLSATTGLGFDSPFFTRPTW